MARKKGERKGERGIAASEEEGGREVEIELREN
jgi:hypothetical protein